MGGQHEHRRRRARARHRGGGGQARVPARWRLRRLPRPIEGFTDGDVGPNLTLFGSRGTLGAGILDSSDHNLKAWVANIRDLKPIPTEGTDVMPTFYTGDASVDLLTEAQVDQVVAYLKSLTY